MTDEFNQIPTIAELIAEITELKRRVSELENKRTSSGVISKNAPDYVKAYLAVKADKARGKTNG